MDTKSAVAENRKCLLAAIEDENLFRGFLAALGAHPDLSVLNVARIQASYGPKAVVKTAQEWVDAFDKAGQKRDTPILKDGAKPVPLVKSIDNEFKVVDYYAATELAQKPQKNVYLGIPKKIDLNNDADRFVWEAALDRIKHSEKAPLDFDQASSNAQIAIFDRYGIQSGLLPELPPADMTDTRELNQWANAIRNEVNELAFRLDTMIRIVSRETKKVENDVQYAPPTFGAEPVQTAEPVAAQPAVAAVEEYAPAQSPVNGAATRISPEEFTEYLAYEKQAAREHEQYFAYGVETRKGDPISPEEIAQQAQAAIDTQPEGPRPNRINGWTMGY
jgi:hypothetical protein